MNKRSEHARRLTRVVAFAAAVFCLGIARAQDDATTLDNVSLKATLENMGLELDKELKTATGAPSFQIVETNERGTWRVIFALTEDKSYLFVSMYLNTVPADRKIPHEVALRMLEANDNWNHPRIVFRKEDRTLRLIESLYNRDIKPVLLRKVMVQMIDMASKTQGLWDLTRWPAEPAAAPPAEKTGDDAKTD